MRPLQVRRETVHAASKFHRAVFRMFGGATKICALCGKPGATDAAHVINRGSKLGPLRYIDPRLARPAHRACHDAQGRGEIDFSLAIRQDATRAHNLYAKQKLQEPVE